MRIKIGQYSIRDWKQDDVAAFARYANNPKIAANLRDGFPCPYTLSDAESFLQRVVKNESNIFLAIANDTEAIGRILAGGTILGPRNHDDGCG